MLAARLLKNNARCHGSYLISHVCTLVSILVSSFFFFLPGVAGEGLCGRRCFRRRVVNVFVSSFRSRRWSFLYFFQESTRGYVYERP